MLTCGVMDELLSAVYERNLTKKMGAVLLSPDEKELLKAVQAARRAYSLHQDTEEDYKRAQEKVRGAQENLKRAEERKVQRSQEYTEASNEAERLLDALLTKAEEEDDEDDDD